MEKSIKISSNDEHLIDGTLNYIDNSCKRLVILIHGLSDNKDNRLVFNASSYFKTKGFHTFRFSLYSEKKIIKSNGGLLMLYSLSALF